MSKPRKRSYSHVCLQPWRNVPPWSTPMGWHFSNRLTHAPSSNVNVVLSSGTTTFQCTFEKITKELTALAPYSSESARYGLDLPCLLTFQIWISKGEYDESGPSSVHYFLSSPCWRAHFGTTVFIFCFCVLSALPHHEHPCHVSYKKRTREREKKRT